MLSSKDVALVYETLLSSPGMNDAVKISLTLPRKQVLLLSKLLEAGLEVKEENGQPALLATVSKEVLEELKDIGAELLKKAGLAELAEKLNALPAK